MGVWVVTRKAGSVTPRYTHHHNTTCKETHTCKSTNVVRVGNTLGHKWEKCDSHLLSFSHTNIKSIHLSSLLGLALLPQTQCVWVCRTKLAMILDVSHSLHFTCEDIHMGLLPLLFPFLNTDKNAIITTYTKSERVMKDTDPTFRLPRWLLLLLLPETIKSQIDIKLLLLPRGAINF